MTMITCTGRDGLVRTFLTRFREEQFFGTMHFFVRPSDHHPGDEFELVLKEETAGLLRVKMMNNRGLDSYVQKGIPEALLRHATSELGKPIESSPVFTEDGQWRNDAATKAWKRLVEAGGAVYLEESGTYRTVV